jgi:predicted phage baseplate assembly protein
MVNKRLGISNGKPGQTFQLQGTPVLDRIENEYLVVKPPNGWVQRWQEVADFADSTPQSPHYRLDSLTGTVQFGPLIREPNSLRYQTQARARIQQAGQPTGASMATTSASMTCDRAEGLEHQYGAIPPVGAEICMVRYRTGGGRQGNVQAHTLQFLQAAVPFVERVTNHQAARNGADAESLEQAVLRVPQFLRTRDRAVTAEDFESLTRQVGTVARVRCLTPLQSGSAGTVQLLVVPQANFEQEQGIHPAQLVLHPALRQQILSYLDERRLLGVQVNLAEPSYVGVSVQMQVGLEPVYDHPSAQQAILTQLRTKLYAFLNPLTGGMEGKGWDFGRPLYPSDIVALLQQVSGVRFIGPIVLFALRKKPNGWERDPSPVPFIDPGELGLICSWADPHLRSSHVVSLVNVRERSA